MTCTPDFCDDHDYPVVSPWCARSWANTPPQDPYSLRSEDRTRNELYERAVLVLGKIGDTLEKLSSVDRPDPVPAARPQRRSSSLYEQPEEKQ